MSYSRLKNDYWRAEEIDVLRSLRASLEARYAAGEAHARLPLQVVVVFIAELEGLQPAAVQA